MRDSYWTTNLTGMARTIIRTEAIIRVPFLTDCLTVLADLSMRMEIIIKVRLNSEGETGKVITTRAKLSSTVYLKIISWTERGRKKAPIITLRGATNTAPKSREFSNIRTIYMREHLRTTSFKAKALWRLPRGDTLEDFITGYSTATASSIGKTEVNIVATTAEERGMGTANISIPTTTAFAEASGSEGSWTGLENTCSRAECWTVWSGRRAKYRRWREYFLLLSYFYFFENNRG